ncbi:MAG: hypothetical protein QW751_01410 [Candidatus Aenigmatarchaeota archaeon]|nr:hypothetical protein [Candidatus Aenigmarchaeota archaeon]
MDLISYETIRACHRAEKDEALQVLPENFFQSVRAWLAAKMAKQDTMSLLEADNAKKLIEDLINRRERKIVMAAIRAVRGSPPPAGMTTAEAAFFDSIVAQLTAFRTTTINSIIGPAALAESKVTAAIESVAAMKDETKKEQPQPPATSVSKSQNGHILLNILTDLPRFIGTDMVGYGPMKAGDMISLPAETAKLLLDKGMAKVALE